MHASTNSAAGGELPGAHTTSPAAFSPRGPSIFDRMVDSILDRVKDGRPTYYADLIADGFTPGQIGTHFPKAKAAADAIVFRQDHLETALREETERALNAPGKTDDELLRLATEHVTGLMPSDQAVHSHLRAIGLDAPTIARLWPTLKRNAAAHVGAGKLAQVA